MFHTEEIVKIEVESPSTDNRYDVPFSELGLTPENAAGMDAVILAKNPGTGVGSNDDHDVKLDLSNERLTLIEGSDGFSDTDIFIVALFAPLGPVKGSSRNVS